MATTTTAQPSVCGHGGSSLKMTELERVTQVLSRYDHTKLPVIYTAPVNMRLADRNDPIFRPVLVSIGPFHRGKFQAMAEHKKRILSSMLSRHHNNMDKREDTNMDKREEFRMHSLFNEMLNAMRTMEETARGYYYKSCSHISKTDFVEMMIFDGCFILEIFRMHAGLYKELEDDPLFKGRWMLPALALDIMKLENQLPYVVLDVLYEITKHPGEPTLQHLVISFLDLLCPGLNRLMTKDDGPEDHLLSLFHSTFIPNKKVDHILIGDGTNKHSISINDEGNCLNSSSFVPAISEIKDEGNCLNSFPSVTDLSLSGIKVVKKKQRGNLLKIEYNNGKLEIPTLVIDHNTKIMMRNLIAYEQCNKTVPDIFTSYVTFMDALVNSAEDVEVLRKAEVINHFMNSNEEVSVLLNNLTANIKFNMNKGYLTDLNAQIYRAHHSTLRQLRARFWRLVNSREGIVYIISIFGFYLAALQTVFTVLSYIHP